MGGGYEVKALKNNDKCVVRMEGEIAVNESLDTNKTLLARAFTEYLLSDDGQAFMNVIIGAGLPIKKSLMDDYVKDVNEHFDFINAEYNDALVLTGNTEEKDKIEMQIFDSCYIAGEDLEAQ